MAKKSCRPFAGFEAGWKTATYCHKQVANAP
jgi:hypothetical protein